jgi:hypothetical protein
MCFIRKIARFLIIVSGFTAALEDARARRTKGSEAGRILWLHGPTTCL